MPKKSKEKEDVRSSPIKKTRIKKSELKAKYPNTYEFLYQANEHVPDRKMKFNVPKANRERFEERLTAYLGGLGPERSANPYRDLNDIAKTITHLSNNRAGFQNKAKVDLFVQAWESTNRESLDAFDKTKTKSEPKASGAGASSAVVPYGGGGGTVAVSGAGAMGGGMVSQPKESQPMNWKKTVADGIPMDWEKKVVDMVLNSDMFKAATAKAHDVASKTTRRALDMGIGAAKGAAQSIKNKVKSIVTNKRRDDNVSAQVDATASNRDKKIASARAASRAGTLPTLPTPDNEELQYLTHGEQSEVEAQSTSVIEYNDPVDAPGDDNRIVPAGGGPLSGSGDYLSRMVSLLNDTIMDDGSSSSGFTSEHTKVASKHAIGSSGMDLKPGNLPEQAQKPGPPGQTPNRADGKHEYDGDGEGGDDSDDDGDIAADAGATGNADFTQQGGQMPAAYGQHMGTKQGLISGSQQMKASITETKVGKSQGSALQRLKAGEKYENALELLRGSDIITAGPRVEDTSEATLRPQFPEGTPNEIIPSIAKQQASDIAFDMFSVVRPGFGLGADNKLVLQQEAHKEKIQWMDNLYEPRAWGGPEAGIKPSPWQFHDVMTPAMISRPFANQRKHTRQGANLARSVGARTVRALPDDVHHKPSSAGLKRRVSPFETIYDNRHDWEPVFEPAGVFLNKRGLKKQYNPWRTPFRREYDPENGGPTLSKRRQLEVILK